MKLDTSGFFAWVLKFLIIVLIFGGFPTMVVVIAKNYDKKAKSVTEVEKALINRQENSANATSGPGADGQTDFTILTAEQASDLQKIASFLSGNWKDKSDDLRSMSINPNGNYNEFYNDKRLSYGLWSTNAGGDSYYFIKNILSSNTKDGNQVFKIKLLDENNLVLIYINADKSEGKTDSFYKIF